MLSVIDRLADCILSVVSFRPSVDRDAVLIKPVSLQSPALYSHCMRVHCICNEMPVLPAWLLHGCIGIQYRTQKGSKETSKTRKTGLGLARDFECFIFSLSMQN